MNSKNPIHTKISGSANRTLEYYVPTVGTEGVLCELPEKLAGVMQFDGLELEGMPNSTWLKLWFRHGAKRVLHVSLIRRSGRYVVEMGGLNPGQVLAAIAVCRDHFDRWFNISARDVTAYERKRRELK